MRGKAKEQLNVLKQVRAAVWAASDADSLLRSVARCVVPDLAEYCVVDAWDPAQRRLSRLEIAHADASLRETLRSARERYAPGPKSRVQQILASGEPLLVENVSDAHRARLEPGDLDFTRRPVASYMAVPVGGRRGETAVLTLVAASTPLRFDEERLEFLMEVASWCGIGLDSLAGVSPKESQVGRKSASLALPGRRGGRA